MILIPLPAPQLGVLAGTGARNQLAEDLKQLKEDHAQQVGVGTTASRPYPMFGLESRIGKCFGQLQVTTPCIDRLDWIRFD